MVLLQTETGLHVQGHAQSWERSSECRGLPALGPVFFMEFTRIFCHVPVCMKEVSSGPCNTATARATSLSAPGARGHLMAVAPRDSQVRKKWPSRGPAATMAPGKRRVPRKPSADQRILELVAHGMHHSTQDGDPNTKRTSGGFKMALLPVFFLKKRRSKKKILFFQSPLVGFWGEICRWLRICNGFGCKTKNGWGIFFFFLDNLW